MRKIEFSVPFEVELTREKSWEALNKNKTSFSIVRFHFQLKERIIREPHQVGDSLAVFRSPKGVGQQHVISTNFEIEEVIQVSSIKKFIQENESISRFASELVGSLGFSKANGLSAKVKSELVERLKIGMTSSSEIQESHKVRKSTSFKITNTIDPEVTEPIVAVPAYKKKAYDLVLGYVDRLKVDYERSLFGLRKKAKKTPLCINGDPPPNWTNFFIPLATIEYWEFMPESSVFLLEKEHKIQVEDADEVKVVPPWCDKEVFVKLPDVASLYQIAHAAFPLKWVMRRSESKEWTVEELRSIELDEVKALGSGWWQQNGNKN